MLRINKLLLHHLIQHLDGRTGRLSTCLESTVKFLKTCKNGLFDRFITIKGNKIPAVDFSELRSDHRIFHETWRIVSAGESTPEFYCST